MGKEIRPEDYKPQEHPITYIQVDLLVAEIFKGTYHSKAIYKNWIGARGTGKTFEAALIVISKLLRTGRANALAFRNSATGHEDTTMNNAKKALQLLKEKFGYEWEDYWEFKYGNILRLIFIPTGAGIYYKSIGNQKSWMGWTPPYGELKTVQFEEFQSDEAGELTDAQLAIAIPKVLKLIRGDGKEGDETKVDIIFTSNPWDLDSAVMLEYLLPFLPMDLNNFKQLKKDGQIYIEEPEAFNGMGISILISSFIRVGKKADIPADDFKKNIYTIIDGEYYYINRPANPAIGTIEAKISLNDLNNNPNLAKIQVIGWPSTMEGIIYGINTENLMDFTKDYLLDYQVVYVSGGIDISTGATNIRSKTAAVVVVLLQHRRDPNDYRIVIDDLWYYNSVRSELITRDNDFVPIPLYKKFDDLEQAIQVVRFFNEWKTRNKYFGAFEIQSDHNTSFITLMELSNTEAKSNLLFFKVNKHYEKGKAQRINRFIYFMSMRMLGSTHPTIKRLLKREMDKAIYVGGKRKKLDDDLIEATEYAVSTYLNLLNTTHLPVKLKAEDLATLDKIAKNRAN